MKLANESGLDVLAQLRAADAHVPVVFVTGEGDEDDRVLGLVSGADDYIVKPFSIRELAARAVAVARRRQRRLRAADGRTPQTFRRPASAKPPRIYPDPPIKVYTSMDVRDRLSRPLAQIGRKIIFNHLTEIPGRVGENPRNLSGPPSLTDSSVQGRNSCRP